jgi:hypothetical protein
MEIKELTATETEVLEPVENETPEENAEAVPKDGEAKTEEVQEEKPKKLGGYKLKLERERAKNQELEQRLRELQSGSVNNGPTEEPSPEKFESAAEYTKALAKWTIEQERKEANKAKLKEEQENQAKTVHETHLERVQAFKKEKPDFDKVMKDFTEEFGEDFELSAPLTKLIRKREVGPAVLYEMAKDTDLLEKLNSLDADDCAVEFGKLEAKLSKPKPTTKTSAPKPVSPISGSKTAAKKDIFDDDLPFSEYDRLRTEQERARRA